MKLRGPEGDARRERLGLVGVVVVAAAIGATTLGHAFVYDDVHNVLQNGWVRQPSSVWRAFGTHFAGFKEEFAAAYYRPAMHVLFAAVASLFGVVPSAFHALNVVFHAGVAGAVFLLARRLLGASVVAAALGALLFAVHPINAESIAWVSGVTDVAATFLGCVVLLCARDGARDGLRAALIGALFLLSLTFKEIAVAFPFVLLVSWMARPVDDWKPRWRAFAALLAGSAVYLGLRLAALDGLVRASTGARRSLFESVATAIALFGQYVAKVAVPVNLTALPVFPPPQSALDPRVLFGVVALAAAGALAFVWRRSPRVLVPALFSIGIAPAIVGAAFGAVYSGGPGEFLFADRYAYLPCVGVALGAAVVFDAPLRRGGTASSVSAVTAIALLGAFSAGSLQRLAVWSDEVTLWTDARAKAPESATVAQYLGSAWLQQGRNQEAAQLLSEATLRDPSLTEAWINLSYALSSLGRFDEATRAASTALARTSRAEAHAALGYALAGTGRHGEAIDAYREALARKPDLPGVHNSLAIAYANLGDVRRARAHFLEAMRLAPQDESYARNLALLGE